MADDFQLRIILGKPSDERSYDDLLALRTRIASFDLFKTTFSGLHPRQLDELCRSLGFETFDHGQVIFNQGDIGDKFYIVLTGACSVKLKYTVEDPTSGDSEIREKQLFTCQPGSHFGERALEFSEPRAATVTAAAFSEIMTITKDAYTKILKAYQEESGLLKLDADNKASIIRVLSKGRDKRTEAELLAVSAYLERRNHFFQKFTADQRIELCRVSELISIYGRTTLFKQWQIGQAFYVILSGTVDVFVNSMDPSTANDGDDGPNVGSLKTGVDGLLVNTLGPGTSFGERALDSDTNQRTASVVTCDHLTELLVISREDYHAIVATIMQEETAEKVKLLRSTLLFKDAQFPVLKELAKYMEARTYHIDSYLLTAGSVASDMIILSEGEALVEIDIEHYNNCLFNTTAPPTAAQTPVGGTPKATPRVPKKGKSKVTSAYGQHIHIDSTVKRSKLQLGRVGPGAVLCTEITQLNSINDDCRHSETIQATTIVSAYVIAKNDYFHHLSADARPLITDLIRGYRPPYLATLWDCGAIEMGESKWRAQNAWKEYRKDLISGKKTANILHNHAKQKQFSLVSTEANKKILLGPLDETQSPAYQKTKRDVDATGLAIANQERAERKMILDLELAKEKEDMKRFIPIGQKEMRDQALNREQFNAAAAQGSGHIESRHHHEAVNKGRKTNKIVLLQGNAEVHASYGHPFSLIHIHREKVKYRAGMGPRRMIKCYFRLCGIMTSCSDATKAAEAIMLNAFISMYNSNMEKSSEIYLNWKQFLSFEGMPLHHTDHLLIYCRTAPMQYCSFSPSVDLLNFVFPAVCKLRGQRYSAISVNHLMDITKPRNVPRVSNSSAPVVERNYNKKPDSATAAVGNVSKDSSASGKPNSANAGPGGGRPGMLSKAPSGMMRRTSVKNLKARNGGGMFGSLASAEDVDSDPDDGTDVAENDEEIVFPDKSELIGQPMLLKEISVVGQVHQCSSSAIEAYRYAKFYSAKNIKPLQSLVNHFEIEPDHLRMCILPMYNWIEISEEVLSHFDRDRMTEANVEESVLNIPKNINLAATKLKGEAVKAQLATAFGHVGLTNFGRHGLMDEEEVSILEPDDKKLTDHKAISVLNEEVDRKRLYDEITLCATASLQGNDQTYVGSLNNAMYLLHEVHPHVVPVDKAHALVAQRTTSHPGTANNNSPVHKDKDKDKDHNHGEPPGSRQSHMLMMHKQVSFSGFTDSVMEVRPQTPVVEDPLPSVPEDLLGVAVGKEALAPFEVKPGIASQPKVSIFQVKGALVKQRNHEIQDAAVAAIRESELKIIDRMDALRKTTADRAAILALHDGICTQEKQIADMLKERAKPLKHKPVTSRSSSPKKSRSSVLQKQLSTVLTHHSDSEGESRPATGDAEGRSRTSSSMRIGTAATGYASTDSSDSDSDSDGDSVAQLPAIKKLGSIPAQQRRSSSAMIIAAMSNVSTATMAAVETNHGSGFGGRSAAQIDHSENERYANRKFKRQLTKSKSKVISDRMELLEGLIKLPSTKAVENDIRQKRWVQSHAASESKIKTHQSHSNIHQTSSHTSKISGAMATSKSTPSLGLKLDVLETMLNRRNGINMVEPSTVEDLGFAENVIPISAEVRDYTYEHKTSVFDHGE